MATPTARSSIDDAAKACAAPRKEARIIGHRHEWSHAEHDRGARDWSSREDTTPTRWRVAHLDAAP